MLQQIDEKLRVRAWEDQLHQFIADLLKNFVDLVESFRNLIDNSKENSPYRRLFSFLGLSATVYPLIIALETEDIIDDRLLTAIEALDLRVYKVRGTNPRAKLYKEIISKIKQKADPDAVYRGILDFTEDFMRDPEFKVYLYRDMYRNPATKYVLWEFESQQTPSFDHWDLGLYDDLQIEHIFPREPTFGFPAYGFEETEYLDSIDRLGNLTLLEERINKRIGNRIPDAKAPDYQQSRVPGTKKLGLNIVEEIIERRLW